MKSETLYLNTKPIPAQDGIRLISRRGSYPGELRFSTVSPVFPGDEISFFSSGDCVFRGKVFTVTKKSKLYVSVAYDLLWYFRNEGTFIFENKTAGELLRLLCLYNGFPIGVIADTKMKISSQIDDVRSLFSVMDGALTLTASAGFGEFVLFDSGGKISLLHRDEIAKGAVIIPEQTREYSVTESIEDDFCNSVRLYEPVSTGRRTHICEDAESIKKFGRIVYSDTLTLAENGSIVAKSILNAFSSPTVRIECSTVSDIPRLRAGAAVSVYYIDGYRKMICERVEHIYCGTYNGMNLTLSSS